MSAIPDDLIFAKEAAALVRYHPASLYRLIHRGELPAYRRGNRYLVSKAAVLSLLEEVRPVEPSLLADSRADERRHAAAMELLRAQGYKV